MKTILVIASHQNFFNEIPNRFDFIKDQITVYQSGKVIKNNDTRYFLMSSDRGFRGMHDAETEFWGPFPQWYVDNSELVDKLIQIARMP